MMDPDPDKVGCVCVCGFGRMSVAVILHSIATGLTGVFVFLLIKHVQAVGFGQTHGGFLEVALECSPWRRMLCVTVGGVLGALSWYFLRGWTTQPGIVSVEASLDGAVMPPVVTLINGMIQDVVVALGGSFGREAAPREIAAMWAGMLADKIGASAPERKVLVACGAGAGLAAVYSVPISGALYTIEHVLKGDTSLSSVIPAIITSIGATIVASIVVPTDSLYGMKRYSYSWPSWSMLLWSAAIGPIAGGAAVCFRRVIKGVEQLKPKSRLPVEFEEAAIGDEVWLLCAGKERKWATVRSEDRQPSYHLHGEEKQGERTAVHVQFADGGEGVTKLDEEAWESMAPQGQRDWHILLAMPTAFLVLGILSQDFPTLLGNGRALGEVAIHRQRTPGFFVMLLFLKVSVTAAAIGSGAAGGTLTPSVALGATIGAIVGEAYQYALPAWAPAETEDAPMSVVAAAAFLAVSMRSPITALFLLVEFSGQGIAKEDLLACLHGDFSGLVSSKLAIGMLLPMSIGVGGAVYSIRGMDMLIEKGRSKLTTRRMPKNRTMSMDMDLSLFESDVEHEPILDLDEYEQHVCLTCFRIGLLTNTCLTIGVGAAVLPCPGAVTTASVAGILISVLAAAFVWWRKVCQGNFEPLSAGSEGESRREEVDDELDHQGIPTSPGHQEQADNARHGRARRVRHILGGVYAGLLAILGAFTPLAPWALYVWMGQGDDLASLSASIASAMAMSACVSAVKNKHEKNSATPKAVALQALVTLLTAGCAMGVGLTFGCFFHVRRSFNCQPSSL